jgi:hypothetical protein
VTNLDSTRQSRDGDQFHYFWAARQCLTLLDSSSDLVALAIEGPAPDDSTPGAKTASAHEIDVAEYYGGTDIHTATRIVYRQLKHSTAQRDVPWRPAGLRSSISRFAKLYGASVSASTGDADKYRYQFVSNRAVSQNVRSALAELAGIDPVSTRAKATRDKFTTWSGLSGPSLKAFFQRFDVDASAPALRELASAVARDLGEVLPGPNSDATLRVKEMVVERATTLNRAPILRSDLLVALKSSEEELFPAPTLITVTSDPVQRESWADVVEAIRSNPSPHIVHASGGVGKTTFALSLPSLLGPSGFSIVYDCYANGAYRKLGEARHNPEHGFIQLSNTLAAYGLCPVLVPDANVTDEDWARAFLSRVSAASSALYRADPHAVLVFVIDAADSSVIAARADVAGRPFVKAIVRQTFPGNVRVVLTARTERVEDLDLPPNAVRHLLQGFDLDESAQHLRAKFPLATDSDAREFRQRTFGNPRIQNGALSAAVSLVDLLVDLSELPTSPVEAFESILQRRVDEVLDESPDRAALVRVLHLLAALRPRIPITVVEQLTGTSESAIRSFASDLGGAVLLDGAALQFKDEPTETLIHNRYMPAGDELSDLITSIRPKADSSIYLASSLPQLLWETGDLDGLLNLAMSDDALPTTDSFERQRVDQSRSVFAVRAALSSGRTAEAAILAARCGMLHAGGSRRTALLTRHPDLGGALLDDVTIQQLVSDRKARTGTIPASLAREGCLLSMNPDSAGDARSKLRSSSSWVKAWFRLPESRGSHVPVNDTDIANVAFGLLKTDGPVACVGFILSWRPDDVQYRIARIVFARLMSWNSSVAAEALARAAAKHVRILLAYASAAFDANRRMVPGIAPILVTLLQKRKTIVTVEQSIHRGSHLIAAAVSWAIACSLEERAVTELDMSILLQRYVSDAAPRGLASDHNDRNEQAFYAIGLRVRLTGETLNEMHFADPQLKEELAHPHSSTRDASDFRRNVPPLVPWIESWVRMTVGDVPITLPSIPGLPTKLPDYQPANTYAHSAPRIAARIVAASEDGSRTAEFARWVKEATYLWRPAAITIVQFLAGGDTAAQDLAIDVASEVAQRVKHNDGDAESRSRDLAELAQAILCASSDEAREYFTSALEQADKAGDDLPNLWDALLKVADRAAEGGTADAQTAYRISRLAESLEPNFEVDFQRTLEVCSKLNLSGGLAIASRWRDRRTAWLGTIASALVGMNDGPLTALDPGFALAFAHYGAYLNKTIALEQLIDQPSAVSEHRKSWVANRVFRRLGEHPGTEVRTILERSGISTATADVHQDDSASGTSRSWTSDPEREKTQARERAAAMRRARNKDLTTTHGLLAASRLLKRRHGDVSFADLAFELPRTQWPNVIRALIQIDDFDEYDYRTVLSTMVDLPNLPASSKAAAKGLVKHVVSRFANQMSIRRYELIPYKELAAFADTSSTEVLRTVLAAGATGVDFSDSESAYAVLGNLAGLLSTTEATQVVEKLTDTLGYLTDDNAPDPVWASHLEPPDDPWLAVASFVWGTLADPDANTRWRATYVVITLCELGNESFMTALNEISLQGTPEAFIDSRLVFYDLHAAQWLLIALQRADQTSPDARELFGGFLTGITTRYPTHALINQLANHILGVSDTPASETIEMEAHERPDRNHHKFWVSETPYRFSSDFVEYWLEPLANCFRTTLDEVEQDVSNIIMSLFGSSLSGRRGEDARRTYKIFRDDEKTYAYKSDDPEVHDLDFYFSYHAMLIVAGKLHETSVGYREPDNDLDDYQRWLRREGLSMDGGWLVSDLRSARPAAIAHQPFDTQDPHWRWSVARAHFLEFVQHNDQVSIDLYSRVKGYTASETVRVSSALVSTEHDFALLRSLQVDRGPYDYRIPSVADDNDIDEDGYTLRGWVDDRSRDLRLDRADPFAKDISFPPTSPAGWVVSDAALKPHIETNSWTDAGAARVFIVDSWHSDDGPRDDRGEGGHRLHVDKLWLDGFLERHSMSLIVRVAIDRKTESPYRNNKNNEDWLEYVDSYAQILLYRPRKGWYDYGENHLAR